MVLACAASTPDQALRQRLEERIAKARPDDPHIDRPGKPGIEQPVESLAGAGDWQAVIASGYRDRNSDVGDAPRMSVA
jgi:hypothetical protein